MSYPYDYNYQNINYMQPQDNRGLLYGSLIAAALSAAAGRNTGDSVLKGLAGGVAGYGTGVKGAQNYYSQLIIDQLSQAKQREYEETEKPYKQSETELNKKYMQNVDEDNARAYQQLIQDQLDRPYKMREERFKFKKLKAETQKAEAEALKVQQGDGFAVKADEWLKMTPEQKQAYTEMRNSSASSSTGMSYFPLYQKMYPDMANKIGTPEANAHFENFMAKMSYNSMKGVDEQGNPLYFSSKFPESSIKTQQTTEKPEKGLFVGAKPIIPPEADVKFARDYTSATALIDTLQNKFTENEKYLPQDATERITKYPERFIGRMLQTNPNLASVDALRTATLPKLIRALGEVGTLTDMDIQRADKAMPTINDIKEVRDRKFNQLRGLISEIYSRGKRQENVIPGLTQSQGQPKTAEEYLSKFK